MKRETDREVFLQNRDQKRGKNREKSRDEQEQRGPDQKQDPFL